MSDRAGSDDNRAPDDDDGRALPTYEDLAARERGPNSRFGRWQAWVEKRAAERYADDPQRRHQSTGWGPTTDTPEAPQPPAYSLPPEQLAPPPPAPAHVTRPIARCLSVAHFGSRFIPHSNTLIETLLPLGVDDRFILFGTARGLSVLDVLPALHGAQPSNTARVLEEAKPCDIWVGEGVWQMALLESQDLGGSNPQGTVLVLVGAEAGETAVDRKSAEPIRTIRMYNLASLTSLVKWSVTRRDAHPIDLRRPANTNPAQPAKKHKHTSSTMFSNFKAMFTDSQQPPHIQPYDPSAAATSNDPIQTAGHLPPRSNTRSVSTSYSSPSAPIRSDSTGEWDIIEDLPLRWATDYVSLSKPGSKLAGMSVLFFELWRDLSGGPSKERTYLAVATRQCIFLYESISGERAFRIVKEFYTPLPARSIRFVQQLSSVDPGFTSVSRSFSSISSRTSTHPSLTHSRNASHSQAQRTRRTSFGDTPRAQLALFVTFPKKAGLIRLGDAAVGEVELWDEEPVTGPMGRSVGRRSSDSLSSAGFGVERERGVWAPLETCNIPPLSMETEPYVGPSPPNGGSTSPYSPAMTPSSAHPTIAAWPSASSQYPLLNNGGRSHPPIDTRSSGYSPSPPTGTAPPVTPIPATPTPSNLFAGSEYPRQVALLTRGRRTDLVESPLRTPVGARPSLCTVMWLAPPSKLSPRICVPGPGFIDKNPYLQIVAFLKEGVDVAEIPLSRLKLDRAKSKGKGRADEIKLVKVDVGGPAGYLASGGRWHRFGCDDGGATSSGPEEQSRRGVQRADSAWSVSSWDSSAQEHWLQKEKQRKSEEGYYAWVCRGHGDFYVVWIGGGMADDPAHPDGSQLDE